MSGKEQGLASISGCLVSRFKMNGLAGGALQRLVASFSVITLSNADLDTSHVDRQLRIVAWWTVVFQVTGQLRFLV